MSALAGLVFCVIAQAQATRSADLGAPVRVEVAGKLVDVQIGHAAPLVTDWDGDGLQDLLVGQFGEGKLLIHENRGSRGSPSFNGAEVFQAGGTDGVVPAG